MSATVVVVALGFAAAGLPIAVLPSVSFRARVAPTAVDGRFGGGGDTDLGLVDGDLGAGESDREAVGW